jgi:hypothetical protein
MEPNETLRTALATYFEENGFGMDGGYDDAWVDFEIGPLPLPFPNSAGRKRAVRLHDLHHIVTGYSTNALGEFEISAWELGAGCKDFHTARLINLGGMAAGAFAAPVRTFRAFRRGRVSRSFYGETYERVLDEDVATARKAHVGEPRGSASVGEVAEFVGLVVLGTVLGLAFGAALLPFVPIGIVNVLRKRRAKATKAIGLG